MRMKSRHRAHDNRQGTLFDFAEDPSAHPAPCPASQPAPLPFKRQPAPAIMSGFPPIHGLSVEQFLAVMPPDRTAAAIAFQHHVGRAIKDAPIGTEIGGYRRVKAPTSLNWFTRLTYIGRRRDPYTRKLVPYTGPGVGISSCAFGVANNLYKPGATIRLADLAAQFIAAALRTDGGMP